MSPTPPVISNVSCTSVGSCRRSTRHTRPNTERCQDRRLECPSTGTFERKNRARNQALLPGSVHFRSPRGALVPDARGRWCRRLAADNYLERRVASRRNVTRRPVVVSAPSFPLQFNGRRLWACGRRLRQWATQAAQRRVVHGRSRCAAGASSTCPWPAGREVFPQLFHTSAGMTVDLRSLPKIISFARSARQALTRRCNVRSCALPA